MRPAARVCWRYFGFVLFNLLLQPIEISKRICLVHVWFLVFQADLFSCDENDSHSRFSTRAIYTQIKLLIFSLLSKLARRGASESGKKNHLLCWFWLRQCKVELSSTRSRFKRSLRELYNNFFLHRLYIECTTRLVDTLKIHMSERLRREMRTTS